MLAGCALLTGLAGCGPVSFLITPVQARQTLAESVVARESFWTLNKVALIDVQGVLADARDEPLLGPPGENPVSLFKEKLDKAAADRLVRAVVLRINSPGGGVTASDLMHTELLRFKEATHKPVIAMMLDVGASGAYYLACGADKIYAAPTSVTGSIGVIMITPDVSGTMQKLGLRANVIKSGPMKDAGSPFREMSPQDRALFQGMIDAMYARFLEVVNAGRPQIGADRIRTLADGRVYLAPDAKANGLIDEVGTLHEAIAAAKSAAGLEGKPVVVVEYARPLGYRANVYSQAPGGATQVNLVNVDLPAWLRSSWPRFMYLWLPGE